MGWVRAQCLTQDVPKAVWQALWGSIRLTCSAGQCRGRSGRGSCRCGLGRGALQQFGGLAQLLLVVAQRSKRF